MSTSRRLAVAIIALLLVLIALPGLGLSGGWLSRVRMAQGGSDGVAEGRRAPVTRPPQVEAPAAGASGIATRREDHAAGAEAFSRARAGAHVRGGSIRFGGVSTPSPDGSATPRPAVRPTPHDDSARAPRSAMSSQFRPPRQAGVQPRGVATVTIELAGVGEAPVRYAIETRPGVRLFIPATGTVIPADGRLLLPVSFTVPADAPAGSYRAGTVRLTPVDGREVVLPLEARVEPRRAIELTVAEETYTVAPGGVAEIRFTLRNTGNVADTVALEVSLPTGWTLAGDVPAPALSPGQSLRASLDLTSPASAGRGSQVVATLSVVSGEARTAHPVRLLTVAEEGAVHGLAHVPTTIFIGSTTDHSRSPAVAVSSEGELAPGIRMNLELRSFDPSAPPTAFRDRLVGPRLLLGLQGSGWELRAGDLYGTPGPLTGGVLTSRGLEAEWRTDRGGVEAAVGRPSSFGAVPEHGRLLRARGHLRTAGGELSLQVSDVEHVPAFGSPYELRAASAGYRLSTEQHRLAVQAGLLLVSDSSTARSGPAIDGRYDYLGERGRVGLRLRRVPGTVAKSSSHGDEAFVSAGYQATPAIDLTGWAYQREGSRLDGLQPDSRGGAAGLGFRLPRQVRFQLFGTYRASDAVPEIAGRNGQDGSVTRSIRGDLDVPLGETVLELGADVGTVENQGAEPYRAARAALRWSRGASTAWAGASYQDAGHGDPVTAVDASASLRFDRARVFGGIAARLDGQPLEQTISFWSGSAVPLSSATELSLGVDYRPLGVLPRLRLSLGVSHRLQLPLPIPRGHALQGRVFEDLNANRVHDAGEPLLSGIRIAYGPFSTATDAAGRFAFGEAAQATPSLDPASLPPDLMLPPDVFLPRQGDVDIPLIRLASISVEVFFDRDDDQQRDAAELGAGEARLTLRDAAGRERSTVAQGNGAARFGSLEPGRYVLIVRQPASRGEGSVELQVEVSPGTDQTLVVALPARTREIRIRDGGSLRLMEPPAALQSSSDRE